MAVERCTNCEKLVDLDENVEGVYTDDGNYLCQDCAEQLGYNDEGNKQELSPQAKKFLETHYHFTELVQVLEKEFEVHGQDLIKASELTGFIIDNADVPFFSWSGEGGEDGEYYGEADYSDFDRLKVTDISYVADGDVLKLEVYAESNADVTLYGDKHDLDYYEPPYYDEMERTVTARITITVTVPSIPYDFDNYLIEVDDDIVYEES